MKNDRIKSYLLNVLILFIFSILCAAAVYKFADKKKIEIPKNETVKKVVIKESFITRKDFEYFLNWKLDINEAIDIKNLSFIAIEELYNTNKLLVNILYLKKIKYILNSKANDKAVSSIDVQTLLNKIITKDKYLQLSRDYILLKLKFEQKKYNPFISDYENNTEQELKKKLKLEYIGSLLSVNDNKKAIDIFKEWYLDAPIRISKLESLLTKKNLKLLFNDFSVEDWLKSFVIFVNEDRQGNLYKLSGYVRSNQIADLFLAEYNYVKKKYSRAKNLLKRVKEKTLLGFKKRILFKIMLRGERYDLLLAQAQEFNVFPEAHKGFLLNSAKLSMKDRPDLSKLLFERYLTLCKKEPIKNMSKIETSEYWSALWRLTWLYYVDKDMAKVKLLLKESLGSKILSYRISSEFWLAELEKRKSTIIDKFPYSYYYIAYFSKKNDGRIKPSPDSFLDLFPKRKTKIFEKTLKNIKLLLKYGLVKECVNYIDGGIKNSPFNITERNFLKFIPLILSIKQSKYGQVIWRYRKSFENYRSIQLPKYLKEIVAPLLYSELIHKYSNNKKIDPYLIMALIKQESSFNVSAVSPSKAYGLMQLLLKTANLMAKKYNRKVYRANLFSPEINIKFGVEYLKELIDKYNGNIYYALAAYNAGDHRVDNWLSKIGNVTDEAFIEMIPFTETRNYVKLVIRNYYYYKFYYL